MLRRSSWGLIRVILLTAFLCALTVFAAHDFEVRSAETCTDDGPIAYARYYANPDAWRDDLMTLFADVTMWSSAQNVVPAMLYKYANVPLEAQAIVMTLIQNVAFGVIFYWLAYVMTRDVVTAVAVPILAFAVNPCVWNLAWYDGIRFAPYAGQLVLPFVLLAVISLLRKRRAAEVFWLLIASTIHPTVTIQLIAVHVVYAILDREDRSLGKLIRLGIVYAIIAAVALVPRLILARPGADGQVPAHELIALMLSNPHFILLTNYHPSWNSEGIRGFALFSALAFVASYEAQRLNAATRRYFPAATAAVAALVLFHVTVVTLRIPAAMQLIGSRSTILWVLIMFPLVVYFLIRTIQYGRVGPALAAAATTLGIGLYREFAYGAPLIALAIYAIGEGRLGPWTIPVGRRAGLWVRRLGDGLLALWGVSVFFPSIGAMLGHFGNGWLTGPRHAIVPLGITGASIVVWRLARRFDESLPEFVERLRTAAPGLLANLPAVIMIGVSAGMAVRMANMVAKPVRPGTYFCDLRDAEVWARDNTPSSAAFLVADHPWRTVSKRQAVFPVMSPMFVYCNSLDILRHNEKMLQHYDLPAPKAIPLDWAEVWYRQLVAYRAYDENDLTGFAHKFSAEYIVRKTSERTLRLPEVYRNGTFVIYRVPTQVAAVSSTAAESTR